MPDENDVLALVSRIYDAALHPDLWDSALEAFSDLIGGAGVNISCVDSAKNARFFFGAARLDPDCGQRFLNNPVYIEPINAKWMASLSGSPVGTLFFREQILTDAEYRRSPLFHDIIRPQKLWHWAFAPLIVQSDIFAPLALLHRPGIPLFDDEYTNFVSRVLPHLVRAIDVSMRLDTLQGKVKSMEALIDRLVIGVIVCGESGRVIQVNRAADAILSAADGLAVSRGHLLAATSGETASLLRLIGEAAGTGRSLDSKPGGAISLSRPSGERPIAILVTPFRDERGILEAARPCAIVFIGDPEQKPRLPVELFAQLYGLTPRQAGLAHRLAGGDNLDDAAQALGITRNTARSHLRLIFDKTGTRRQSELTRLLFLSSAGEIGSEASAHKN